jgi:hypothetical protein
MGDARGELARVRARGRPAVCSSIHVPRAKTFNCGRSTTYSYFALLTPAWVARHVIATRSSYLCDAWVSVFISAHVACRVVSSISSPSLAVQSSTDTGTDSLTDGGVNNRGPAGRWIGGTCDTFGFRDQTIHIRPEEAHDG